MSDAAVERFETPSDLARRGAADATPRETPADRPHLTPEQARLLPFYHDLRNEIVQPDKVVVSTQYFWSKWAPRLGPTLTALVICLRRHCYYNRATQERRDWCFPEQATLAREIGVETTKTIRAALQHSLAGHFVRREARYVYDPARGKKVRTSDMYYIAMDDPLVAEDETLLAIRAAERLVSEGRGAETIGGASSTDKRSKGQKDRQITRRNAGPSGGPKALQVEPPAGQIARQDSAVKFAPEVVPVTSTNTTTRVPDDPLIAVVSAFEAANGKSSTPAQIARLHSLCGQFESAARRAQPAATGAEWIIAAIREAVESGSHFVAPRRIVRICERWAAVGRSSAESGPSSRAGRPERSDGERRPNGSIGDEPMSGLPDASNDEVSTLDSLPVRAALFPSLPADSAIAQSFVIFPELGLHSRPFWQTVCEEARRRLGSSSDVTLLVGSRLLAEDANVLTIGVPGRSVAERADLRLKSLLVTVMRSIVGRPVDLRFVGFADWVPVGPESRETT